MRKKSLVAVRIEREEQDLARLLQELPTNPIAWASVVKLVAPIVARLAIRYALRRLHRGMSEDKVNQIAGLVGDRIRDLLKPGGPGGPEGT